ncbi:uncharacterized protein EI90DRAFT_3120047 [Cantharellus anzutake]|uniref:uncharacterized protein n=1 Tax=Cantharellus anzutake TaxID=1750568 RepID=UPI001904200C|nr:uncharacterized protein EI90DRAFT_3120047 [Cantharellus anzutake]KAF8335762.1 hypothetical protein EI90DRAFT_3120047 [Cantharellus anzutake]
MHSQVRGDGRQAPNPRRRLTGLRRAGSADVGKSYDNSAGNDGNDVSDNRHSEEIKQGPGIGSGAGVSGQGAGYSVGDLENYVSSDQDDEAYVLDTGAEWALPIGQPHASTKVSSHDRMAPHSEARHRSQVAVNGIDDFDGYVLDDWDEEAYARGAEAQLAPPVSQPRTSTKLNGGSGPSSFIQSSHPPLLDGAYNDGGSDYHQAPSLSDGSRSNQMPYHVEASEFVHKGPMSDHEGMNADRRQQRPLYPSCGSSSGPSTKGVVTPANFNVDQRRTSVPEASVDQVRSPGDSSFRLDHSPFDHTPPKSDHGSYPSSPRVRMKDVIGEPSQRFYEGVEDCNFCCISIIYIPGPLLGILEHCVLSAITFRGASRALVPTARVI